MKKWYTAALLAAMLFMFAACEKAWMQEPGATRAQVFDYLWLRVDEQYSMFDVKQVDWKAVYDSLRPMVNDTMSSDSLFAVCAAMLDRLNDGHVNLVGTFDVSRSDSVHRRFYSQSGVDMNVVVLNYLGSRYHSTGGLAHSSLCDGKVIYVYYGSFNNGVSEAGLRHIIAAYPEAKGMILDLRGNGGGSLSNVNNLLSVMPSNGQILYYSQIKSGPGHDQFTPLEPTYAPVNKGKTFDNPVVVLTDRGCFSATSTFAVSTQAYDNLILMGDTTGGGMGLPTMGVLPNGWRYRFSITRTIALDGRNYENGVPPDILLPFDRSACQTTGRDNIIDSACAFIVAYDGNRSVLKK